MYISCIFIFTLYNVSMKTKIVMQSIGTKLMLLCAEMQDEQEDSLSHGFRQKMLLIDIQIWTHRMGD